MCLTLYCKNLLNSSKDRPCLMLAKRFITLAPESKRNISYPYNPAIVWSVDHILMVFVDFISSQNPPIHPNFSLSAFLLLLKPRFHGLHFNISFLGNVSHVYFAVGSWRGLVSAALRHS